MNNLQSKVEYDNAWALFSQSITTNQPYATQKMYMEAYMKASDAYYKVPSVLEKYLNEKIQSRCEACNKLDHRSGIGWGFNK